MGTSVGAYAFLYLFNLRGRIRTALPVRHSPMHVTRTQQRVASGCFPN